MPALILIDVQRDFVAGGKLPVPMGEKIIPWIELLVTYPFDLIIATKDWHPPEHGSFAENHMGKLPGDRIQLGGVDQILWPAHAVQGTLGAEFTPGWDFSAVDKIIYKGMDPSIDSYSAFFDNSRSHATGLEQYLRERGITHLFFVGLATDYCVKYSVLDAQALGFHAYVIREGCRGVNLEPHDVAQAFALMQQAGAQIISMQELPALLERNLPPGTSCLPSRSFF